MPGQLSGPPVVAGLRLMDAIEDEPVAADSDDSDVAPSPSPAAAAAVGGGAAARRRGGKRKGGESDGILQVSWRKGGGKGGVRLLCAAS